MPAARSPSAPRTKSAQPRDAASLEDAFIAYLLEATGGEEEEQPTTPSPHRPAIKTRRSLRPCRLVRADLRLRAPRTDRNPARPRPARLRPPQPRRADDHVWLRRHIRRRKPPLRRVRPRPERRKPPVRGELRRLPLLRPEAARCAAKQEIDQRLRSGELRLAIDIPPGFGRDLLSGHQPEVAFLLDGAMPFRAETARGYVEGIVFSYAQDLRPPHGGRGGIAVPGPGRSAVPLQSGIPKRRRDHARLHHDPPDHHPLHADGARRRAGARDRLHQQPPGIAGDGRRIPAGQAGALRGHRLRELPPARGPGRYPVRCDRERLVRSPGPGGVSLRIRGNGRRPRGLDLRHVPGRGDHRDRRPRHGAGHQLLRLPVSGGHDRRGRPLTSASVSPPCGSRTSASAPSPRDARSPISTSNS